MSDTLEQAIDRPVTRLSRALPYLVLLGGVMVAAAASILIRYAQGMEMPSTTIAAGRLGLAAIILLPIAWSRAGDELRRLSHRDVLLGIVSGVFLAVHFAAWISSLAYTSVASSVALVSTNPLWVALLSAVLLRERPSLPTIAGVVLTIAGSVLIGISDSAGPDSSNALLGNLLALLGAFGGSIYFLVGRSLRRHVSVLAYIWLVYTSAAVALLIAALAFAGTSNPLELFGGYPPLAYLLLLSLAIGPQLLGHTAFNWSLRYLSATFVTVALLGEPIGSALLALILFGEWFAPLQLAGFVLLLIGIAVAARGERGGE
ncbi:DMT family transporter [Roseiflexus sp.]|uniref:DMT family transporter n=1 Tax=Roseiflexus sp. TaxID=2562120 RepID=UPI00398B9417